MCRLAHVTTRFPGIEKWFNTMQRSFGGDGNGVAIATKRLRGVGLTNRKIASWIYRTDYPALYHTRRVSVGARINDLCHPFHCGGGWLAHNGTWMAGLDIVKKHGISDSLAMAMLIDGRFGGSFAAAMRRLRPAGVWLWAADGGLFVHVGSGQLYYSPSLDAWGSEPAEYGDDWYRVAVGDYCPGDIPQERCVVRETLVADRGCSWSV